MKSEMLIEIGRLPFRLQSEDCDLKEVAGRRYDNFLIQTPSCDPLTLTLRVAPDGVSDVKAIHVSFTLDLWRVERMEFRAEWRPSTRSGWICQAKPAVESIDSVLRILHSLM